MVDEAGISAIICLQVCDCTCYLFDALPQLEALHISAFLLLQSEACFEAMQIDWPAIRQQAISRGVTMTRVAVRDFDHNDQVQA